jgi:hypothetical protein
MLQALIDRIQPANLNWWFWLCSIMMLVLPIIGAALGAAFGYVQLGIGDKLNELAAENASKEIAHLNLELAPWTLNRKELGKFTAALKDAPKGEIVIECTSADEKRTWQLKEQLKAALTAEGYTFGYGGTFVQAGGVPLSGIHIYFKTDKASLVGGAIQRAFQSAGLEAPGSKRDPNDATWPDDDPIIIIGMKP